MGLMKDTMKAILRIDQNLAQLVKVQTMAHHDVFRPYENSSELKMKWAAATDGTLYQAQYLQKPIEPKGATFDRVMVEKDDQLTFGGRLKAIRMCKGLNQTELAADIGISSAHVSKLESDLSAPSAMLIRSVSTRYGINERWLATGHLPQTTEEPAKPIATSKLTPLSGYEHEADMPSEIMIDFGKDRGLLPVQRSPLVDKNISQENI